MTSVVIGNNVISVWDYAFDGCTNLTDVTLGNGLENFGAHPFNKIEKLKTVTYYGTPESFSKISMGDDVKALIQPVLQYKDPVEVSKVSEAPNSESPATSEAASAVSAAPTSNTASTVSSSSNIGLIIGIVIGVILLLIVIVVLILVLRKKK